MAKLDNVQNYVTNDLTTYREELFGDMQPIQFKGVDSRGNEIAEARFQLPSLDWYDGKKISGLIGGAKPSNYSGSPKLWNSFFQEVGIDGAYMCFDFPSEKREDFPRFLEELLNVQGILDISVTDPYKSDAYEYLSSVRNRDVEFSAAAKALGVVNHIIYDDDKNKIYGLMTDGAGMIWGINTQRSIRDKRVFLLGAGGAASAIAYELIQGGVSSLHIANRRVENAQRLKNKLNSDRVSISGLEDTIGFIRSSDILIYAIEPTIELKGIEDAKEDSLFVDVRYGEKEKFAKLGMSLAHKGLDGKMMLYGQYNIAARKVAEIEKANISDVDDALNKIRKSFLK